MDRLSGWYKRRTQAVVSVIGIILALITNADSISLVNQLWHESTLRNNLAIQAESYINQNQSNNDSTVVGKILQTQSQFLGENLPIGWIGEPIPIDKKGVVVSQERSIVTCTSTPRTTNDIFGLPIAGQCYPFINTPQAQDSAGWLLKVLGLIVTALATGRGAPFWFDVLKKIINIRSSGLLPHTNVKVVG